MVVVCTMAKVTRVNWLFFALVVTRAAKDWLIYLADSRKLEKLKIKYLDK